MKELRIVFMGTPDFAVPTLAALLATSHKIMGVITAPDKPAGRGQKIQESPVKKFAHHHNLPILQPTNLKDPQFLQDLKSLGGNLQIVVAFRMLPEVVWRLPHYGTFNLHASLLPQYRGAAPINWVIINGERKTGVTTFFINEQIDTGEIIMQESVEIGEDETAGSLHETLMHKGADLVVKTVTLIAQDAVHLVKQPERKNLLIAPKIHKDTCRIIWAKTPEEIHRLIRGVSPHPGAWTLLINKEEKIPLKIYRASIEKTAHTHKTGAIWVDKKQLKVAVKDGYINLEEIQLPGKRKMLAEEVVNGLKIDADATVA